MGQDFLDILYIKGRDVIFVLLVRRHGEQEEPDEHGRCVLHTAENAFIEGTG